MTDENKQKRNSEVKATKGTCRIAPTKYLFLDVQLHS